MICLRLSSSLCRMSWKNEILLRQEVMQQNRGIFICQSKYALEVSERFGKANSNMVCNPIVP